MDRQKGNNEHTKPGICKRGGYIVTAFIRLKRDQTLWIAWMKWTDVDTGDQFLEMNERQYGPLRVEQGGNAREFGENSYI